MDQVITILIVEDDKVEAIHLEILLTQAGYQVLPVVDNAIDVLVAVQTQSPDLVLMDINIKGDLNGIDLVYKLKEIRPVAVIFLTAHDQDKVFAEAKATKPAGFITKPVDPKVLERSIEMAFERQKEEIQNFKIPEVPYDYGNLFFTKIGNKLKKIPIKGIEYIEVEGKYSSIVVDNRKYHVKVSLKDLEKRLPSGQFVRVSRNFMVNMDKIDNIDTQAFQLLIGSTEIPISRTYKEGLMKRIQLI